jgi:hypothetical protein
MSEETKRHWRQFYAVVRLLGVVLAIGTVFVIGLSVFQLLALDASE